MATSNPFRARNLGNPDVLASPSSGAPVLSKSQSTPPVAPNGYGKSSISLEREVDDSSSNETNPFNPDLSASESDDDIRHNHSSAADDRPQSFGSAPHRAPSTDGSSASSISSDRNMRSTIGGVAPDEPRDHFQHATRQTTRQTAQSPPDREAGISPSSRKDKKPPPPPKSHHGRRISSTSAEPSQPARSRSTNRLSIHDYPGNVTPGASYPSSVSLPPTGDYFSSAAENHRAMESSDSLHRSNSQSKRPPTPPLSRRHSQMRRSKSTQSKHSRLTMSSYDSESNDGSRPPSPGPSIRSLARKRMSMPPTSSGDLQPTTELADVSSLDTSPPTTSISRPSSLKAGRRASSYGQSPGNAGSTVPPPPPPPRRTRDSMIRSSDTVPVSMVENQPPPPQPSNALDILADLTKLQKEVDDLRGHYENRKG